MWTTQVGALVLIVTLTPALAFELPDIGDPSGAAISPEQEHRIGQAFLRQTRRLAKILDDPEVEAYIQSLGYRLAAQSNSERQAFEFFLVEDPSINAFAAPGGLIGMHTGLLLNTETESELASVLAHEIAHVTQRHMARTLEKASQLSLPMAAAMLGAILLSTQNPQAGQAALAAVTAGSAQYQLNFTRENEEEADRIGMQILAGAGFDPRGMPAFFERLQLAHRLTDNPHLPEFLRTHPVTVSRIADSRNRAEQFPRQSHKSSLNFYLARTKIQILSMKRSEAVHYYRDRLETKRSGDENVARYGYVLALTEAGEYAKARVQVEHLLEQDSEQLAYLLAAARLGLLERDFQRALRIYSKASALYPDYRPVTLGYAKTLLTAGQPDLARRLLRRYATHHEPDIAYYTLLAEAEGKAGAEAEAHIALAEAHYLSGETGHARERLKFAQHSTQVDRYQWHRIEARLKEIERELEEEKNERRFKF